MSDSTKKTWDFALFKRIFTYTNKYKSILYAALILTTLLAVVSSYTPYLIGKMVSEYISQSNESGLFHATIIVSVLLIIEGVAQYAFAYLSALLGQNIIRDLRIELFAHVQRLKMRYFDTHPIGMLVTRAVSDIETIADMFTGGVLTIVGDIQKLLGVLIFMFYIDWELTLLVLIPLPLLLIATNIFKNAIKRAFQDVRTQVSRLNTFVQERLTGIVIVKSFAREQAEFEKFKQINAEHRKAHIRSVWAYSIFFPVVELLSALSIAILVIYSVWEMHNVQENFAMITGKMTAFIMYTYRLFRPIRMLADRFNTLQMGLVGTERVFKVLDTDEKIENKGTVLKDRLKGKIDFDHVSFAYNEKDTVLKDISFHVNPGETIAFVGATGAGKSSIINLLSRYYEYQEGSVLIDDVPIRDYELDTVRKNVAVVLQDVFLYSDTIYHNITLGDPSISREEVIEASKLVGAHDFIMQLPGDYDFDVKERGGMLSVGQRQLISFIRAYVYNPSILVLDEATSSIDSHSEELIQKATDLLTKGRTSIVIAHRLATIQNADRIIVLEKGRILEQGSHGDLLQKDGQYRKMYDLQFQ